MIPFVVGSTEGFAKTIEAQKKENWTRPLLGTEPGGPATIWVWVPVVQRQFRSRAYPYLNCGLVQDMAKVQNRKNNKLILNSNIWDILMQVLISNQFYGMRESVWIVSPWLAKDYAERLAWLSQKGIQVRIITSHSDFNVESIEILRAGFKSCQ